MKAKEIAAKIKETIVFVDDATKTCGSNVNFYNEIAKELRKQGLYGAGKLEDILNVAMVLDRIRS